MAEITGRTSEESKQNDLSQLPITLERTTIPRSSGDSSDHQMRLKLAAFHRTNDHRDVVEILQQCPDPFSSNSDDEWMLDFLNTEGNNIDDLATLLVNEKYDSPWILRPDYDLSWDNIPSRSEIAIRHADNCIHNISLQDHLSTPKRETQAKESNDNKRDCLKALQPDLGLGLAGFMPLDWKSQHPDLQHDAWLDEWASHIQNITTGNSVFQVSYTPKHPVDDGDEIQFLIKRTTAAMNLFLDATGKLQESGFCCDRLPVMVKFASDRDISTANIKFSVVNELAECLSTFSFQADTPAINIVYGPVLGFLRGLVSASALPDVLTALMPTAYNEWRTRQQRGHFCGVLRDILRCFGPTPLLDLWLDYGVQPDQEMVIDCAAIAVQALCLALQSFSQAHIGKLRFSFLDEDISEIQLTGRLGGTYYPHIVAYLQELTCFGKMTKEPVLVFQNKPDDIQGNRQRCNLVTTLETVIDIWGKPPMHPVSLLYSGTGVRAVQIGHGLLFPQANLSNDSMRRWHWTSQADPEFTKNLETIEMENGTTFVSLSTPINVGTVSINSECPLSSKEGQKLLFKRACDHLKQLDTFEPFWNADTRQANCQGGQWIVVQGGVAYKKMPGRTKKQSLIHLENRSLINDLSNLWGVQLSLCTGVLQRVSLQKVLAATMESYMRGRLGSYKEWTALKAHKIIDNFDSGDVRTWFDDLPHELHEPTFHIVKEVLKSLEQTGVDHKNHLRNAWAKERGGFQCFPIPCDASNFWARILTDGSEIATFAYVTPLCLETRDHLHQCQECPGRIVNSGDAYQLSTQVRPVDLDHDSKEKSNNWTLNPGRTYWIGREDLLLMADVTIVDTTLVLKIRRSSIPRRMFRRFQRTAWLRETNDPGAVECLVVSN